MTLYKTSFFALLIFTCTFCTSNKEKGNIFTRLEARADSLVLVRGHKARDKIPIAVQPVLETDPIHARPVDDAADDPAIWIHPHDRSKSLIYGSNKKGGLAAYDLNGKEVAYYPIGNINNVDVLYNFPLNGQKVALLGCSNRSSQSVNLFRIDTAVGKLDTLHVAGERVNPFVIDDIYGFCFAKEIKKDKYYAVINGKNGILQQREMLFYGKGITLKLQRQIIFSSKTEGMVADNHYGNLFVGEEGRGVWKLQINPNDRTKTFLKGSSAKNPNIEYDIEGIALFAKGNAGYLIVSSQGNFSYALFERTGDHAYINSFKIIDSDTVDGVEETDGLHIVSDSLSPQFPHGLLVVQDGFNYEGNSLQPQNFKFIRWE